MIDYCKPARQLLLVTACLLGMTLSDGTLAATIDIEGLQGPDARETMRVPNLDVSERLDQVQRQVLKNAMHAFVENDFLKVEELSRSIIAAVPEAPEAWYLLGLALVNLDRKEEALEALTASADRFSRNAEPLVVRGDIQLSMGRREDARQSYLAAAERDPANWQAQESLAVLAELEGDRDEAARRYQAAVDSGDGKRLFPTLQLARLALLGGDAARAARLLESPAAAEDALDRTLELYARALIGLDRMDESRLTYDRLVARGTSLDGLIGRAKFHIADGDLADAEVLLNQGTAEFPNSARALLERGSFLGATGRYSEAAKDYEAGLKLDPENGKLLRGAALAHFRLGDTGLATQRAETLANRDGATEADLVFLADLFEATGETERAAAAYRRVIAVNPNNWIALNNLAIAVVETAPDEALSLAMQASEMSPGTAAVRDTLGWAQFKSGHLDAAAATFEAARREDPAAALPLYRLGLVRLAQGDTPAGRALLEQALTLDPGFSKAEDARRILAGP